MNKKNCPLSLHVWDASLKVEEKPEIYSEIMTCEDVNKENNNASCAFYDQQSEKCSIREGLLSLKMLCEPKRACDGCKNLFQSTEEFPCCNCSRKGDKSGDWYKERT